MKTPIYIHSQRNNSNNLMISNRRNYLASVRTGSGRQLCSSLSDKHHTAPRMHRVETMLSSWWWHVQCLCWIFNAQPFLDHIWGTVWNIRHMTLQCQCHRSTSQLKRFEVVFFNYAGIWWINHVYAYECLDVLSEESFIGVKGLAPHPQTMRWCANRGQWVQCSAKAD